MREPLTVLQMVPNLESGGVERGTIEVADELVRLGHRSHVISGGGRMVDSLLKNGTSHHTWQIGRKSPLTVAFIARLRRFVVRHNVDIVHARSRVPAWVAFLALKTIPKKIRPAFITTVHGLNSVSRYSEVMTYGDPVIAVSNTAKDYVMQNYARTTSERIRVIHRGIDPATFPYGYQPTGNWKHDFFAAFPQLDGHPLITLPGRLTRLKGHADLLTLMGRLRQAVPGAKALIVGGEDPRRASYARELYQQVREQGLESTVFFSGHRDDVREILAISSVVLSLSKKPESFGRTVVEAMSLGTPVVGYDHGGVGEVLADWHPAGLVTPNDEQQLLNRVSESLANKPVIPQSDRFTLQKMLDSLLEVYYLAAGRMRSGRVRIAA